MKLAEALLLRSDLNKKLLSVRDRIVRYAVVQEGEQPHENPEELHQEEMRADHRRGKRGKDRHVETEESGKCRAGHFVVGGYLRKKLSGHVSYERAISGQGLISIYNFLKDTGFAQESIAVREHMNQRDPAAVIGEFGVQREDALCTEALRIFCSLYGAETGNLALKCLP